MKQYQQFRCVICNITEEFIDNFGVFAVYKFPCSSKKYGSSSNHHYEIRVNFSVTGKGAEVSSETIEFDNIHIKYFYISKIMDAGYMHGKIQEFPLSSTFENNNKITTVEQFQNFLILA